jgi:hypothetical protein
MSEVESPSTVRRLPDDVRARHPHREIAELLATAIARARVKNSSLPGPTKSEVGLGFSADQRVNANPSYTEGVQK